MFGFERGAFTDARRSKPGLLQAAHRGTIFLDEVGLLPEALQAKLLKVLEDRMVRRLGATRDEPVDVWIVTATNEDLAAAVQQRRFREDLYHRLAVLTVALPPLRERAGDVLQLAEHFLARTCTDYGVPRKTLSADARAALVAYRWPGNVRELSNVLERAVLMSAATEITAEGLGLPAAQAPSRPRRRRPGPRRRRSRSTTPCGSICWRCSRRPAGTSRAPPPCSASRATRCAPAWTSTACAREPRCRHRRRRLARGRPRVHRPSRRRPLPRPSTPRRLPCPRLRRCLRPPVRGAGSGGASPCCGPRWCRPAGPDAQLETGRTLELVLDKIRSFGGRDRRPRSDRCRGGLRPDGDRRRGGSRRPQRHGDRQGGRARPARGRRRDRGARSASTSASCWSASVRVRARPSSTWTSGAMSGRCSTSWWSARRWAASW